MNEANVIKHLKRTHLATENEWKERAAFLGQERDELERLAKLLAGELHSIHSHYGDREHAKDHSHALLEWDKWEKKQNALAEPGTEAQ